VSSCLSAEALTVQFGHQRALDDLSFTIPRGVTGLVGANGSGKTTLLTVALGLRSPTSGSLSVLGRSPAESGPELRTRIGYSPEGLSLPADMPALDFVTHMARLRGIPRIDARVRSSEVLWLVGLGEERMRALGTMSTGQRQRVKLAQAVASSPSLLLLDEPTDGLDPVQRDEMLTLIARVASEFAIDVVVSSHVLEEVERICDYVIALDSGSLVTSGRLDELVGTVDGLEVELVHSSSGECDAVLASLLAQGAAVERDGLVLTLHGPDRQLLTRQVRDALAEHHAGVRRISSRRRRLDDLFEQGTP